MTHRLSVLCSEDTVWALPCWDRTLSYLAAEGIKVSEFITTSYHPSIGRTKESPYRWYVKRFGILNFARMAAFALLSKSAGCVTGAPRSYAALCQKHAIPHRQFTSVKEPALLAHFRQIQPHMVAIMVPEIIPASLIACCTGGMINQHPSLLPKYRGLFPYIRAAIAHDAQGVTLHRIDTKIDAGDILHQYRLPAEAARSMIRAHAYMMLHYPQALLTAIQALAKGTGVSANAEDGETNYFSTPDAETMRAFFRAGGKIIQWHDLALGWRSGAAHVGTRKNP